MPVPLHRAPCGTCGGAGITYGQTTKTYTRRYWDKDADEWMTEEIEEMVVTEHPCKTCGGKGVR